MERCPSCAASATRWMHRRPVPPAARWIKSLTRLRPYTCDSCGWHGWRVSPAAPGDDAPVVAPREEVPPTPVGPAASRIADVELDDSLLLFPPEEPRWPPTPLPTGFSAAPARRQVPGRKLELATSLVRSGLFGPVAPGTALRHWLAPATLGAVVIDVLAVTVADRHRPPATGVSTPTTRPAETATSSMAAAAQETKRRVEPLAGPPVHPRPSTPRQQDTSVLNSLPPAPGPSPARAQAARTIPNEGTYHAPTAPPSAPRFRGALVVESVPEGAQVFVDRQAVGSTPVALRDLPAGSRVVRVEADGYELWSAAVRVVADQRTRVTAQLGQAPPRD